MVLKRNIATKVKYTNRSREQDMEWALKLGKLNLIKKEYNIEKNLYVYNYNKKTSILKDKKIIVDDINHNIQPINKKIVKFI